MEDKILEEKVLTKNPKGGFKGIIIMILMILFALGLFGFSIYVLVQAGEREGSIPLPLGIIGIPFAMATFGFSFSILNGIRTVAPNEALVLTLFGKYYGTLKTPGFYFVNIFCKAINPASGTILKQSGDTAVVGVSYSVSSATKGPKISLKIMTLNNNVQKINDCLGNPIEIGIAVMWRVTNTAKACFNVENYKEYLSLQCDAALRNIVSLYPYDVAPNVDTTGDGIADEGSLRGSKEEVARRIKNEIQNKVCEAGLEIVDARITYLAYATEIAAIMLQRQQAAAIIDARKMIVDGAVSIVEMALDKLEENHKVKLDDEKKAAMVSNLLVVLCGNKEVTPVISSSNNSTL